MNRRRTFKNDQRFLHQRVQVRENHEKQVQNLQFRSERSLSLTFRDRVKTNQGEIFFINKTGQNIFIFLK